jgi:hypothetical protein
MCVRLVIPAVVPTIVPAIISTVVVIIVAAPSPMGVIRTRRPVRVAPVRIVPRIVVVTGIVVRVPGRKENTKPARVVVIKKRCAVGIVIIVIHYFTVFLYIGFGILGVLLTGRVIIAEGNLRIASG